MFTLLIDELASPTFLPDNAGIGIFVDDVAYRTTSRSLDTCARIGNQCLASLSQWSRHRNFTVSLEKTVAVLFSLSHKTELDPEWPQLIYNAHPVPIKDVAPYLGVLFDKKLKWKAHREYLKRQVLGLEP